MKKQNRFRALDRPLEPSSETKLGRARVITAVDAVPTTDMQGWSVQDWNAVLLTVHPTSPLVTDTTMAGATVKLRVWRWRRAALGGTDSPSGQWYAEEEFTVALDGDMVRDESMERSFTTNVAEKIYFQVIEINKGAVSGTLSIALTVYGLGPKRGEEDSNIVVAMGSNRPIIDSNITATLEAGAAYADDTYYSNLRDDFTAAIASTTTITLTGLPSWFTVTAPKIVAIGIKHASNEEDYEWIYNRGSTFLDVSYAAGTITFASPVLTVGYDVAVWIEGFHRFQMTGIDDTPRVKTRSEALTEATLSERTEEIDPIDTKYVGDVVADVTNGVDATYTYYLDMSSFRKLGLQLEINGGSGTVTVTIEGTIQDDGTAAASCTYQDIGSATFGAASWTADAMLIDNAEKLACYKYIKIKVVASTGGADDGDWTIYAKRLY